MPSEPGDPLTRHDPGAWNRTLAYRDRAELPFDPAIADASTPVMLDTTVYIDALKPHGLPEPIRVLVARNVVLHSSIACAELAVSIGHLDPKHAATARQRAPLADILARIPPTRTVAPDTAAWIEAAIIAGIVARIQGYQREARRAVLFDALMLLTSTGAGTVLISRNVRHMDLLLRFRPDARVLLYDRPAAGRAV